MCLDVFAVADVDQFLNILKRITFNEIEDIDFDEVDRIKAILKRAMEKDSKMFEDFKCQIQLKVEIGQVAVEWTSLSEEDEKFIFPAEDQAFLEDCGSANTDYAVWLLILAKTLPITVIREDNISLPWVDKIGGKTIRINIGSYSAYKGGEVDIDYDDMAETSKDYDKAGFDIISEFSID